MEKELILNNGIKMPSVGLGVWAMGAGSATENAVFWALEAGYRHIDTASVYGNEEEVGNAIRKSGVQRNEIFVTTKLWNDDQGYKSAFHAFDKSLSRLKMDYVDLYLIHWPFMGWGGRKNESLKKREESWKALEEIYQSGKAKAIGGSNY